MSSDEIQAKLKPLTKRQGRVFEYIRKRIMAYDPPTIREIGEHFKIASPNGVMGHINYLVDKGWLKKGDHAKSRSLRLTEAAIALSPKPTPAKGATK